MGMLIDSQSDDERGLQERVKEANQAVFNHLLRTQAEIAHLLYPDGYSSTRFRSHGYICPANNSCSVDELDANAPMILGIRSYMSLEINNLPPIELNCGIIHGKMQNSLEINPDIMYEALRTIDPESARILLEAIMQPAISNWENVLETAGRYDLLGTVDEIVEDYIDCLLLKE